MSIAKALKEIVAAGRPLIEQSMYTAGLIAALRDAATEKGIDWSAVKALLKAQIQDENDNGERVKKIVDRATNSSAYADLLGIGGEKNNSPPQSDASANANSARPLQGSLPSGESDPVVKQDCGRAEARPAPIRTLPAVVKAEAFELEDIPAALDRRPQRATA